MFGAAIDAAEARPASSPAGSEGLLEAAPTAQRLESNSTSRGIDAASMIPDEKGDAKRGKGQARIPGIRPATTGRMRCQIKYDVLHRRSRPELS